MVSTMPYKPSFEYALLFNGQDITALQTERFTQKKELNLLKKYDFTYDDFSIKIPFDYKTSFIAGINNNIIQVNKSGAPVFVGYAAEKVVNVLNKYYEITSHPFLNLLSKSESVITEVNSKNVINEMTGIFSTSLAKISNYYSLSPQANSLSGLFKINCFISDTRAQNDINLFLSLCEMMDVGVYFSGTTIYFYAFPEGWDTSAKAISEAAIDNYVTSPVNPQQATELYYNQIKIGYKSAVGGTEKTASEGNGSIIKSLSFNNIYLDDASASALAKRKYNIYSRDYYTIEKLAINKFKVISLGDLFSYAGFYFICTAINEDQTTLTLSGVGIEI